MAFSYDSIVPWGRSFEEYRDMFHLTPADLDKRILGCGDGPACFNSIMTKKGKHVVSIDPVYAFTAKNIENRINETYNDVINQTKKNKKKFIWTKIKDVEELGKIRMASMKEFLKDYEAGKEEKRYIEASLPELPFIDKQFDLSLCSHFLFLYTDNLTSEFHIKAINEMLRVSNEARIFPLLDVNANVSPYVREVKKYYNHRGFCCEEVKVNYEFQKNGNKMLRIF